MIVSPLIERRAGLRQLLAIMDIRARPISF
jgi:hypothetical protein